MRREKRQMTEKSRKIRTLGKKNSQERDNYLKPNYIGESLSKGQKLELSPTQDNS